MTGLDTETLEAAPLQVLKNPHPQNWLARKWNTVKHAAVVRAPLLLLALNRPRLDHAFGILVYHRVCPRVPGIVSPTWNVTPQQFRRQLEGLLQRGYQPWPLSKALDYHQRKAAIPRNVFVVTFDDGYANNYHYAWPILRELQIPSTIFLATAYLDSDEPFPFDDWSQAGKHHVPEETWKPLTTTQCHELQDSGLVELGAHTHTHADFRGNPEALYDDLSFCRDILYNRFNVDRPMFAFPYGVGKLDFSDATLADQARQSGMQCSLSTESTLITPNCDTFTWGRFDASSVDSGATLAAKLDGWYSWLRELAHDRSWLHLNHLKKSLARWMTRSDATAEEGQCANGTEKETFLSTAVPANRSARPVATAEEEPAGVTVGSRLTPKLTRLLSNADLRRGALSVFDQAIVSGTSFATSVIIGRVCLPEQLGIYFLALSLVLVMRDLQILLIAAPYTIYCSRRRGRELSRYTGSTLIHHFALAAASVLLVMLLIGAIRLGLGPPDLLITASVLLAVVPLLLLREFIRRLAMARLHLTTALFIDAAVAVLQLGGLLGLAWFGWLSVSSAYLVMGLSCALAATAWFLTKRQPLRFSRKQVMVDWYHNWAFSKWLMVTHLLGGITPYLMPWVLVAARGEAATGLWAACCAVVGLSSTFVMGVSNFLLPRASRAFLSGGVEALQHILIKTALVFVVTVGAFCVLVFATGDLLAVTIFGNLYAGSGTILLMLAGSVLANSVGMAASHGLMAMDRPQANIAADLSILIVTLVTASVLISSQGVLGAAIATLAGTMVGCLIRWFCLLRLILSMRFHPQPS